MKKFVSVLLAFAMMFSLSGCVYFEKDMEEARAVAYESGYAQGKAEGYEEGYDYGYAKGFDDGYDEGYTALKPIEEPESGTILSGKNSGKSTITIYAYEGSCVFSLRDVYGTEVVTFYVREGDTVVINVPRKNLYAYYACGFEWYGYGKGLMFGEDTDYLMDVEVLDFATYSYTYTMGRGEDGRFLGDRINEDMFFG